MELDRQRCKGNMMRLEWKRKKRSKSCKSLGNNFCSWKVKAYKQLTSQFLRKCTRLWTGCQLKRLRRRRMLLLSKQRRSKLISFSASNQDFEAVVVLKVCMKLCVMQLQNLKQCRRQNHQLCRGPNRKAKLVKLKLDKRRSWLSRRKIKLRLYYNKNMVWKKNWTIWWTKSRKKKVISKNNVKVK